MPDAHPRPVPAARPVIAEEDIEAAVRVLRSGMVVQGPEVKSFEQEFAEVVGGRECVAVNSGTSAWAHTGRERGSGSRPDRAASCG